MNGGGGPNNDPPPPQPPPPHHNDGDFLLRLLQNHQQQQQQQQQQQFQQQQQQQQQQLAYLHHNISATPSHTLPLDPAVAALGPTMPIPTNHHQPQHHDPHRFSPQSQNPNFPLQGFHRSSPNSNHTPSLLTAPHQHFDLFRQQQQQQHQQQQQQQQQQQHPQFRHEQQGLFGNSSFLSSSSSNPVEDETLRLNKLGLEFGLLKERELVSGLGSRNVNGFDPNRRIDPRVNWGHGSPDQRWSGPPPGFSSKPGNQRRDFYQLSNVGGERSDLYTELKRNPGNQRRDFDHSSNVGGERSELYSELKRNPGNQRRDFDQLGNVGGERSDLHSELKRGNHGLFGSNSKSNEKDRKFMSNGSGNALIGQLDHPGLPTGSSLHSVSASDVEQSFLKLDGAVANNGGHLDEVDDLSEQLVDSVLREDQPDEQNDTSTKKKHYRDKDFRSDARGKWILSQRMRNNRRMIECRRDIDRLDAPFLAIYDSLIPAKEEKEKQKQLMKLLEKLVQKEWPDAKLSLYGSCANSFGVSKSDIDVCLAVDDQDANKSEMLLRLADILQSDYQDVQALTRARVPIVKLRDPVTGISCDICVNNVLAVVNTKLLRDYAAIDPRLRQLAFLVKHWAKSRGVNETYQGTLSSYAYVLMCIHFLQKLNPPILPCLQNMKPTYVETVDDIKCNFFDRVEILRDFGAQNEEKISKLLWGFFNYWAYCHDYANHVISVRTGSILRKEEKDWTRRIGNDRHLICIEDPFETSHDLGRVVDKRSIRVLREEFERAAEIMQYDPNPCVALFEPYIPC